MDDLVAFSKEKSDIKTLSVTSQPSSPPAKRTMESYAFVAEGSGALAKITQF
ncbi:hypothetical protein CHS0354_021812, partial [Potamilus streckersoni]